MPREKLNNACGNSSKGENPSSNKPWHDKVGYVYAMIVNSVYGGGNGKNLRSNFYRLSVSKLFNLMEESWDSLLFGPHSLSH